MNNKDNEAELYDLLMERWLRDREEGKIKWTNQYGDKISIKNLSDQDLNNIIKSIMTDKDEQEILNKEGD